MAWEGEGGAEPRHVGHYANSTQVTGSLWTRKERRRGWARRSFDRDREKPRKLKVDKTPWFSSKQWQETSLRMRGV